MASVLKISALLLALSFAQPEMAYLGAFRVPVLESALKAANDRLAKLLAALQQALK